MKPAHTAGIQMRQEIFKYKGKHILYNTGTFVQAEEETKKEAAPPAQEQLSQEQMNVVLGSMSDNRITDSVKDLVEKAGSPASLLSEEQRNIVSSSMSDNRITDSVKEFVEKAGQ